MGSFLVKMAIFAVIIVGLVFVVKYYTAETKKVIEDQKSFDEVVAEDKERLRAPVEAEVVEEKAAAEEAVEEAKEPVQEAVEEEKVEVKKVVREFAELSEEAEAEAARLFEMAITERSMARLPGMTFNRMVKYCREIIAKWPDSEYAYKARRMLGEVPQRHWRALEITEEEVNLDR